MVQCGTALNSCRGQIHSLSLDCSLFSVGFSCPLSGPVARRGSLRGHRWQPKALLAVIILRQDQWLAVALYKAIVGGSRLRVLWRPALALYKAIVGGPMLCWLSSSFDRAGGLLLLSARP